MSEIIAGKSVFGITAQEKIMKKFIMLTEN